MGVEKQGRSITIVMRSGLSNLAVASTSLSNSVQIEMAAAVWVPLLCSAPGQTHLVWSVCDFRDLAHVLRHTQPRNKSLEQARISLSEKCALLPLTIK